MSPGAACVYVVYVSESVRQEGPRSGNKEYVPFTQMRAYPAKYHGEQAQLDAPK